MARPIAETPILYGEDAERFMYNMRHVKKEPPEVLERMERAYQKMKAICTFPV